MTGARGEDGSIALTTILLLPLLLIVVTGVVELGVLRIVAYRAALAADLATLVAINDQDAEVFARTGTLVPGADAGEVAREYFAANLDGIATHLASPPRDIAAEADVAVYASPPAIDARTGARYDRPTVRLLASVPIRTPGLAPLLLPGVVNVTVRAASAAR